MSFGANLKSLFARCREHFSRHTRTLISGVFLLGGALGGMPIRPEDIEKQLQTMSQSEIVQILKDESQSGADPPSEPEASEASSSMRRRR